MSHTFKIGVDGGATKTELILLDEHGRVRHTLIAPGCNPSVIGESKAREILLGALNDMVGASSPEISTTLLCMAGSPAFWRDFALGLDGFGKVRAWDDAMPTLELATNGQAGMVMHSGTGSFVAARDRTGAVHYAGGLGWRFGDEGSGYDIGLRGIGAALFELQGWTPVSALSVALRTYTHLEDAKAIVALFYQSPQANALISGFAPLVLERAERGERTALEIVANSATGLLRQAESVAAKLFSEVPTHEIAVGVSGQLLTRPWVMDLLSSRSSFTLRPVADKPIEGVRRLLAREF